MLLHCHLHSLGSACGDLHFGTTYVQGMMQHILDCLGALRVRMKDFPIAPKMKAFSVSKRK